MSQADNIIGPLDYQKCKNSAEHETLLRNIITNLNDSHGRMVSAEKIVRQTDTKFEVFKKDTEGNFMLVNEKFKNLKEKVEETQLAVSGVTTTKDLSAQNEVLLAGIMEIVKGKGENKRAWIGLLGGVLVALIMAASAIVNLISNDNNEKKMDAWGMKIELLEKRVGP